MIYAMIFVYAVIAVLTVSTAVLAVRTGQNHAEVMKLRARYEALRETLKKTSDNTHRFHGEQTERMNKIMSCVEDLRNGIVPDYEKAKAAANAVNDFHDGLAGIMGFDPMEALKKSRNGGGNAE